MTTTDPASTASGTDSPHARPLAEFNSDNADMGWHVVNDNVMGGRSEGGFVIEPGLLVFSGRTNTDGGGFSSIRTGALTLDLSNFDGVRVRVKGDGRRYTWRLATDANRRGRPIGYWADFKTRSGEWTTVDIPFARFVPRFRGTELDGPPLDAGRIRGMGLMIYDKKNGDFEIRLDNIHAYKASDPADLADYRWQKRVLLLSAPGADNGKLKTQLDAVARTRDAFDDRHMALVVLLDAGAPVSADRVYVGAHTGALRDVLDLPAGAFALRLIGKDGSVKHASGAPTDMADIYALIDTMPMRQRERGR